VLILTRLAGQRVVINHRLMLELIDSDKQFAHLRLTIPQDELISLDTNIWHADPAAEGCHDCRIATSDTIMIGDNVTLLLVETRVRRARIGFRTPPGLTVFREEIYRPVDAACESV